MYNRQPNFKRQQSEIRMLKAQYFWIKIGNFCLFWAPGLVPSPEDTPPHTVSQLTVFSLRCSFMITLLERIFLTGTQAVRRIDMQTHVDR